MYPLGSKQRPIIVKVRSQERAEKVAEICSQYDFTYILGFSLVENISDLKKAIKEQRKQANPYDLCSCNSGKKYRFCCSKKKIELDL
jgi:uncharacterized protein YecA (UPF0149 family)